MKVQVIIGSTREHRISEKPARWINEVAQARSEWEAELVDLRDYPMPFFDEPHSPARLHGRYSDERVQTWSQKVSEADAYIIVSPEYNHGYPAVLKNAMDVLYPEWNNKPVGFVSYGNAGGARSVEQLRLVAIELQMMPIQKSLNVPTHVLMTLIRPQAGDPADPFESIRLQADTFLDQLLWWTKALKTARTTQGPIPTRTPPAPATAPVMAGRPA